MLRGHGHRVFSSKISNTGVVGRSALEIGHFLRRTFWMISGGRLLLSRPLYFEYPQMWVWPQVPLGGPPPSTPLRSLGRPLPEPCKKSQGGWGEEGRRGRGGKGFGLREGSSNDNGGWGGALQTPVGARPCVCNPHIQESPHPRAPKSPKSLKKEFPGLPARSVKKVSKKSTNTDFVVFLALFLVI